MIYISKERRKNMIDKAIENVIKILTIISLSLAIAKQFKDMDDK